MATLRYPFPSIEADWQGRWKEAALFDAEPDAARPKWFVVELGPFANGRLHLGHVRNYVLADALARFRRQAGFNVLYTTGFDSFGLPNEMAARRLQRHPVEMVESNMEAMAAQFERLGLSHDRRRYSGYHEPRFYRWVQLVFLRLFESGLVFQKARKVNWCAQCETTVDEGLVSEAGLCWRCEAPVEGRLMEQWFLTEEAVLPDVIQGLDALDGWSREVKEIQRRIVGLRTGARVDFSLPGGETDDIQVFLEEPELLPGVTFLGVGPRHALIDALRREGALGEEMRAGLDAMGRMLLASDDRQERRQKYLAVQAVDLGVQAAHPLTGERIPVVAVSTVDRWSSTAAMAGVPAHRRIDNRLAELIGLPSRSVLRAPEAGSELEATAFDWKRDWVLSCEGEGDGMTVADARRQLMRALEERGLGGKSRSMSLGPWHLSRQRYWATPIPVVHCSACGAVPVDESELPVELPVEVDLQANDNPLAKHAAFVHVACPRCGGAARRDADTLDVYFPAWWFLWLCKGIEDESPFESEDRHYWMPVDLMIGGIDQARTCYLHTQTLARQMVALGLAEHAQPIDGLLAIGMVKSDGEKLSKSKNTGDDVVDLIERYGADSVRLAVLIGAGPERDFNWDLDRVLHAHRFLGSVWDYVTAKADAHRFDALEPNASIEPGRRLRKQLTGWIGVAVDKTTRALVKNDLHIAAQNVMTLFESINRFEEKTIKTHKSLDESDLTALTIALRQLLLLMTPLTPHLSEELWRRCGGTGFIAQATWPQEVRSKRDSAHDPHQRLQC